MPTYVYEFEETGESIEVDQSISDKKHEYLLHPERLKLMKVKRVISGGAGVIFKGMGWTAPGNKPTTHDLKFPQKNKIEEKHIKNKELRSSPKRADTASPEKLREARKFQDWIDKGGGAESLNKKAPDVKSLNKK